MYCDQEPLWLSYLLGVHIRLSSRCKINFTLSLDCLPFRQKSHECALKLTDLWNTMKFHFHWVKVRL